MRKHLIVLFLMISSVGFACTSVIVSGKATADGKPLMLKHRDTDDQNNRVEYFRGERYNFLGLVNSDCPQGLSKKELKKRKQNMAEGKEPGLNPHIEVWTGTNTAGFSIMNTASYNFREDTLDIRMDREGEVMYLALSLCATIEDFETLLDTITKPMGCEANFGVIDAHGGAAYYEVNNFRYVKFDVNQEACGYRVVTNFCESGRREDYKGWERYLIASDVMKNEFTPTVDHRFFFNRLSRNTTELDGQRIPRKITSASIVIEGVAAGGNPKHIVMWTILGNPLTHKEYPLRVRRGTRLKMK